MTAASTCIVRWGDLVLHDLNDTANPYQLHHDGFSLGSTRTMYEAVASLMLDGSYVRSPGHENRDNLGFTVEVRFSDSDEAAEYQEALEREAGKATNTLTFEPRDGIGTTTVFETFEADLDHDWDQDNDERGVRYFPVKIPALPFVRGEEVSTIAWSGGSTELDPLTSLTGWTTSGGTPTVSGGLQVAAGSTITMSKTLTVAGSYVWAYVLHAASVDHSGVLVAASINGVSVPLTDIQRQEITEGHLYFHIPAHDFRGQSVAVSLTLSGTNGQAAVLKELWSVNYPNRAALGSLTAPPPGIDVIDVEGSARTPCTITFTAPAGGAFVYTAPDPDAAVRRGAGEIVFGNFTVSAAGGAELAIGPRLSWFPAGTHSVMVGSTLPQPIELAAAWPQAATAAFTATGVAAGAFQYVFPAADRTAISFYDTAGAKALVSPTPALPEGYHGGALHHEIHSLHAGRCGFAVLDKDGNPVATTITYYARRQFHAR